MKQFFVAIVIFLTSMFASAEGLSTRALDSAGWDNLSEAQKAEVIKNVAATSGTPTAERVGEWVDIGQKVGQMMGGAAKEVGVAVNEFVKTPVGKWTMVLVIWKFMGSAIIHIFGCLLFLFIGLGFIFFMVRRSTSVEYTYDPNKTDIFGRSRLVSISRGELSSDAKGGYSCLGIIVLLLSALILFTF